MKTQGYSIELFGIIQGVGFRPFVYHLACEMGLHGYVQNCYDRVVIYLEVRHKSQIENFLDTLLKTMPPHAYVSSYHITPSKESIYKESIPPGFEIRESQSQSTLSPCFLPPDMRLCKECLKDMRTKGRFYQYAFTTCTYCGARYSIINALPYDRIHTTMRNFPLCKDCQSDYSTASNRRFHAQPTSCLSCAIRLYRIDKNGTFKPESATDDILLIQEIAQAIKAGKIVAIKGVGGFNLIVDASNKQALSTLRQRKNRPKKPFALMFKDIAQIESLVKLYECEKQALLSPQAPIVLCERHFQKGGVLDEESLALIAPRLHTLGVILPYNGIMSLLFDYLDKPIVFTSANLASEPIITKTDELVEKLYTLNPIADVILSYNRSISHGVDDSIVRFMAGAMRPLRLARGYAPLYLPQKGIKAGLVIGVGAQQKSNLCFIDSSNQACISPYIGDLQSVDSIKRYDEVSAFFRGLYKQDIALIVHDLHPQYISTQKAQDLAEQNTHLYTLSHHKAHFYAILAEHKGLDEPGLGIIWDGTGLGEDACIWGGECFLYQPGASLEQQMQRIYHFDYFTLLGGESGIKDIGKLALSMMWHYDVFCEELFHFSPLEMQVLQNAYKSGVYKQTSSLGRIIDGAAYILGLLQTQSYEGESGALLESYALQDMQEHQEEGDCIEPYGFEMQNGVIIFKDILLGLLQERAKPKRAARRFLESLAHIALSLAKASPQALQTQHTLRVYFSGGVFQNKFLCDKIQDLFTKECIPFYMHQVLPCNDANISFGQAVFGARNFKAQV